MFHSLNLLLVAMVTNKEKLGLKMTKKSVKIDSFCTFIYPITQLF